MNEQHEINEKPLEEMFNQFLEKGNYNMVEEYLEMVKGTFSKYEEYKNLMYTEKANDLTQKLVQEE